MIMVRGKKNYNRSQTEWNDNKINIFGLKISSGFLTQVSFMSEICKTYAEYRGDILQNILSLQKFSFLKLNFSLVIKNRYPLCFSLILSLSWWDLAEQSISNWPMKLIHLEVWLPEAWDWSDWEVSLTCAKTKGFPTFRRSGGIFFFLSAVT